MNNNKITLIFSIFFIPQFLVSCDLRQGGLEGATNDARAQVDKYNKCFELIDIYKPSTPRYSEHDRFPSKSFREKERRNEALDRIELCKDLEAETEKVKNKLESEMKPYKLRSLSRESPEYKILEEARIASVALGRSRVSLIKIKLEYLKAVGREYSSSR